LSRWGLELRGKEQRMNLGRLMCILLIPFVLCSCNSGEDNKNVKTCQSLNSAISKDELIKKIGQPYKTEVTEQGVVLYYESNPFAAGPVRILVEQKTGMVIGKKCFEDDEWTYFTDLKR
jgi:hypothetical protein